MPPSQEIDPREKEMAALRARYAKLRGQESKGTVDEKKIDKGVPKKSEPVKKSNPYIRLIKHDIENFIRSIRRFMGLKSSTNEIPEKSLNLSWLEKNERRFFK